MDIEEFTFFVKWLCMMVIPFVVYYSYGFFLLFVDLFCKVTASPYKNAIIDVALNKGGIQCFET
jgi:hypothetical protein